MNDEIKVVAVVVTFNRKMLLMECLRAVLAQTYSVFRVILIDNCSTDGTRDALIEKGMLSNDCIDYICMDKNIGGAGGFYEGIKRAIQENCDWVWVMDDDTVPDITCLEKLLEAGLAIQQNERVSFLASAVYGLHGEYMNVPDISYKKSPNGYCYWYQYLDKGMINISQATFVSILIWKEAVKFCGLPCKDYFIWGDDSEYTQRLTTYYGEAYMVGNSIATHKRINAGDITLITESNAERMKLFRYCYRNSLINTLYYRSKSRVIIKLLYNIRDVISCIGKPMAYKKIKIIVHGSLDAIIQYKKFKKYIDMQLIKRGKEESNYG